MNLNDNFHNYEESEVFDRIYKKVKITSNSLLDGDGGAKNNEKKFQRI